MTSNVVALRVDNHTPLPDGYVNGPQLAAMAGITYRKVTFWTQSGYLHAANKAPGSGSQRLYPAQEVAVARLIGRLVADGLLPHVAAARARELLDTGTTLVAGMPLHLPQEL